MCCCRRFFGEHSGEIARAEFHERVLASLLWVGRLELANVRVSVTVTKPAADRSEEEEYGRATPTSLPSSRLSTRLPAVLVHQASSGALSMAKATMKAGTKVGAKGFSHGKDVLVGGVGGVSKVAQAVASGDPKITRELLVGAASGGVGAVSKAASGGVGAVSKVAGATVTGSVDAMSKAVRAASSKSAAVFDLRHQLLLSVVNRIATLEHFLLEDIAGPVRVRESAACTRAAWALRVRCAACECACARRVRRVCERLELTVCPWSCVAHRTCRRTCSFRSCSARLHARSSTRTSSRRTWVW